MLRNLVAVLGIAVFVSFSLVACGEDAGKLADKFKAELASMDLASLKTKAEGMSGDMKDKALKLVEEVMGKKEAAMGLVNQLVGAKGADAASLLMKAKDSMGGLTSKLAELKKMLGM